jgi:glycosyltransferase involved in cell wall biosynthesis
MKIIHLAPHCQEDGNGVVNVAVDFACEHAAAGHSVGFASARGSFIGVLERYGVKHFEIEQDWTRPIASARGFLKLGNIIGRLKPDIVHAHAVPGAIFASRLRKRSTFRLITSIHNMHRPATVMMGVGDVVIPVSCAVAAAMQRRGLSPNKLRVVKNGPLASPRRFAEFCSADGRAVQHPAIITVAGLLHNKGIADLITAFTLLHASVPEASLHILGKGPQRAMFEAQAAKSGCADRVHFVGFVKDPRPYLYAADIFVLASHMEAFPLALGEAREAGCAIVASDVGGVREALDDGEAGILLPAGQPRILADTLASLLGNVDELNKWKIRAAKNLNWLMARRAASEALDVYQEAISSKAGPNAHPSDWLAAAQPQLRHLHSK